VVTFTLPSPRIGNPNSPGRVCVFHVSFVQFIKLPSQRCALDILSLANSSSHLARALISFSTFLSCILMVHFEEGGTQVYVGLMLVTSFFLCLANGFKVSPHLRLSEKSSMGVSFVSTSPPLPRPHPLVLYSSILKYNSRSSFSFFEGDFPYILSFKARIFIRCPLNLLKPKTQCLNVIISPHSGYGPHSTSPRTI